MDLGGRFTDAAAIVAALCDSDHFGEASAGTRFGDRLQLSYRHGQPPEVVAARGTVDLRLPSWTGPAHQQITLNPTGVVTYELELPIEPDAISVCTDIEDDLDQAMRVRYLPYLQTAFGSILEDDISDDDRGIDFISPTLRIRELVSDHLIRRPHLYPGIDIRTLVSVLVESLDASEREVVAEFVEARRTRAQLSSPPKLQSDVGGLPLEIQRTAVLTRRWRCLLYASCDTDAALIIANTADARQPAHDCVAMAQKMWYLARCWAGVLDQVGTLEIREEHLRPQQIHELERRVLDLSTLEFEVAASVTTAEATGVMLRDTWHVELFEMALRRFGMEEQQRLIERRLHALARNHDTVAEILDRFHQHAARSQAEQLQLLFAGSVAASVTALLPAVAQVSQAPITIATAIATSVGWVLLAVIIWRVSKRHIRLARAAP